MIITAIMLIPSITFLKGIGEAIVQTLTIVFISEAIYGIV